LRKYIQIWPYKFVPLLSRSENKLTSLQGRVVTIIQQHKKLSLVACVSIMVLLINFFVVPAHSSNLIIGKSQFLSTQACANCSSTNISSSTKSRDAIQEPFVIPPRLALAMNTSGTSSPPFTSADGILTINAQTLLPAEGSKNLFPYGSCTWWANQRYFQLNGIYVPWRIQSNAWQWTIRAEEFGWNVSSYPVVGSIIDLQPRVQGASWAGHVAIVERILSNGKVIASNMNWGAHPWQVTFIEFAPGPGVTFLYLLNSKFLHGSSLYRRAAQNF
jgi:CHAP domain-containing protein